MNKKLIRFLKKFPKLVPKKAIKKHENKKIRRVLNRHEQVSQVAKTTSQHVLREQKICGTRNQKNMSQRRKQAHNKHHNG